MFKFKKMYLAFIGLLTGLANGLFGSGGGLVSVPMLEHFGLEEIKAHATSLALTLPLSAASAVSYFNSGNLDLAFAAEFIPFGLLGALVGAKILLKITGKLLKLVFSGILIFAGIRLVMG